MNVLGPLLFAMIAALGNAMFAAGQKKALIQESTFSFIVLAALVCVTLTSLAAPLLGPTHYERELRQNGWWAVLSGAGLFLTYLGFNLLYTHYGTSHYILYAVLSIITTSILVGVVLFRENFNVFHWLAFGCSILAVVLFSMGNKAS